ncbi:MAG: hypothetical protein ACLKAK_07160 [Alkaliphilus sp.]
MKSYALEIDFNKVVGYKTLSFAAKQLFHKTYDKHSGIIGTAYKEKWKPVKVNEHKDFLWVYFKNGEWIHYYADGTWG